MVRIYGKNHRAVTQTYAILGQITDDEDDPFRTLKKTKHGETRIAKCIKYDLHDYFRLVTIHDGNAVTLVFVGSHDDEEAWLEQNKGLIIGASDRGELGVTKRSNVEAGHTLTTGHDVWTGKLTDRLNDSLKQKLFKKLDYSELQSILSLDSGSGEEVLKASVALVPNEDQKTTILDVLILLNQGDIEGAEKRIGIYLGTFKEITNLSDEELIKVDTGTDVKRIKIGSEEYRGWVDSFINSKKTYEWFLFMHPEQEKYVIADYNGPAKLSGVSGSGKTAIAIARAIRLAKKYSKEKILILTLNTALADLISDIVSEACEDQNVRNRIDVLAYFDLAIRLVHQFEPENKNLYTDITLGLEEHKDEIYREYYRCMNNNFDASILKETHFHLVSQGVDAESYIAEEFDWIRSTRFSNERKEYLEIDRTGRSFPLIQAHREKILVALEAWEKKMLDVGVIDTLGLTTVLSKHLHKITPKYRSIIVDEAQDFGTTEISIVRKLVDETENDLFLCGDAAQQVQPKRQNFKRSGVNVTTRSFTLKKNYRNSKEILEIAYDILLNNLSEEHLENSELEISDPEFAVRSSPRPVLLKCNNLSEEIAYAIQLMRENSESANAKGESHTGCIAISGYSQFEIEQFGKKVNLNVLNGDRKKFEHDLFLSDLEQTKGYEFDTMVIANCNEGILPPKGVPRQELYRFVSQFYVAMTRAKSQLIMSTSDIPSSWLTNENIKLDTDQWDEFIDPEDIELIGKPEFLPDFPGESYANAGELLGDQYIFTEHVIGMQSSVLEKIFTAVPSQLSEHTGSQNPKVKLKNIDELYKELSSNNRNPSKEFFSEGEAHAFVSSYLNAELKIENKQNIEKSKSVEIAKVAPTKIKENRAKKNPQATDIDLEEKLNDLRTLKIPAPTYALLFSLKIRTLKDLIKVDSKKLRDHLPAKRIREIKKLAKDQLAKNYKKYNLAPEKTKTSVRIKDAGFKPRTLSILKSIGVNYVEDLQNLGLSNLNKNPKFGNTEFLEIKRVAKGFGITLKND